MNGEITYHHGIVTEIGEKGGIKVIDFNPLSVKNKDVNSLADTVPGILREISLKRFSRYIRVHLYY